MEVLLTPQVLEVLAGRSATAVAMTKRDAGDLQDMATLNVMETCSRWARKITHTERIPEYVAMAYRHAMDSNPGPVYLEITTDLLYAQVDE